MTKFRHILFCLLFSPLAMAQKSPEEQFFMTFGGLIIVLGVIFLLTFLLKKTRMSSMLGNQSKIKIISQLAIGQRERIMVLDVNGEQILVGITAQQITHLKTLENPISLDEVPKTSFSSLMEQNKQK